MIPLLIIPDVHNRFEWAENLVAAHTGHKVIFLGDYFDSQYDTPTMARQTAEWLRYSVDKGRTHLMGNHDLPYRWKHMNCPGYHVDKHREVSKFMSHSFWERVRLYDIIQVEGARPLVLSHAGFTLANLHGVEDFRDVARGGRLEFLRDRPAEENLGAIRKHAAAALRAAHEQRDHFWFNQGSRMGERNVGGPFWLDRSQMHSPLPGIDQIVGHSIVTEPRCQYSPNKTDRTLEVWFIDGAGRYAATIDGTLNEHGGLKVTPIHARGDHFGKPTLWD